MVCFTMVCLCSRLVFLLIQGLLHSKSLFFLCVDMLAVCRVLLLLRSQRKYAELESCWN